jgi:uncharacterized membrane protein YvbJ
VRTLNDIYRCIKCGFIAARGNSFCRDCGIKFDDSDIVKMKANVHSVVGATPWNTRDVYRCVHCSEHIALADKYCRGCGDEIEDHEKQLMKMRMSEIAKENTPSLIGLALFVLCVIGSLMLMRQ